MTRTATLTATPGPLTRIHQAVVLDEDAQRRIRLIAVLGLIALNICDLVLTRRLLSMGGVEANPLMAPLVHTGWGVALKLGLPVVLAVRHLRAPVNRTISLGLCWMCVLYFGVVLWNSHLLDNAHLLG
jgi:hypothetical protein